MYQIEKNGKILIYDIPDRSVAEKVAEFIGDCNLMQDMGIISHYPKFSFEKRMIRYYIKSGGRVSHHNRLTLDEIFRPGGRTLYQVDYTSFNKIESEIFQDLNKAIDFYLDLGKKYKIL